MSAPEIKVYEQMSNPLMSRSNLDKKGFFNWTIQMQVIMLHFGCLGGDILLGWGRGIFRGIFSKSGGSMSIIFIHLAEQWVLFRIKIY